MEAELLDPVFALLAELDRRVAGLIGRQCDVVAGGAGRLVRAGLRP